METNNATDAILNPTIDSGRSDAVAILFGEHAITFAELSEAANRFGNALKPNLARQARALLMLKDSPTFVAAFLEIMRIGAVTVPLSTRLSAADLAFAIDDSGAEVLLIDEEFLPLYRAATPRRRPRLVAVNGAAVESLPSVDALVAAQPTELRSEVMDADDMAFWLYTSGTTGTPKAAIHCHGDVTVANSYMAEFGIRPGARVFSSSKMFFAFALGHTLIGGLRSGATIILYDGWPDAAAIGEVVARYRPTVMLSVPTFYRNVLRDGLAGQEAFRQVGTYISAGEALPESLYRRWLETTGVPIVEGIGATETIFMFISGTPANHRAGATGKPMPYAEVRLLDEIGQPVTAPGTTGVAHVKLGSLCRGYWQQPERTRAAFRDGWFRTGDAFSVDSEGWWHHHGRYDDLLKISGQWVSPSEIEDCAISVPGVVDAAAVGVANEDGLVRLALFLVGDRAAGTDLERAVREKLLANLSVYKCPRNIRIVDVIPRTATGKAQRYLLRQLAAEIGSPIALAGGS